MIMLFANNYGLRVQADLRNALGESTEQSDISKINNIFKMTFFGKVILDAC